MRRPFHPDFRAASFCAAARAAGCALALSFLATAAPAQEAPNPAAPAPAPAPAPGSPATDTAPAATQPPAAPKPQNAEVKRASDQFVRHATDPILVVTPDNRDMVNRYMIMTSMQGLRGSDPAELPPGEETRQFKLATEPRVPISLDEILTKSIGSAITIDAVSFVELEHEKDKDLRLLFFAAQPSAASLKMVESYIVEAREKLLASRSPGMREQLEHTIGEGYSHYIRWTDRNGDTRTGRIRLIKGTVLLLLSDYPPQLTMGGQSLYDRPPTPTTPPTPTQPSQPGTPGYRGPSSPSSPGTPSGPGNPGTTRRVVTPGSSSYVMEAPASGEPLPQGYDTLKQYIQDLRTAEGKEAEKVRTNSEEIRKVSQEKRLVAEQLRFAVAILYRRFKDMIP